jgi:hypothetical protein
MHPALHQIAPDHRARLEALLAKRWTLPGGHPLAALDGAGLGDFRLLVLLGPRSSVGSYSFQLLLLDGGGRLAEPALALGLHSRGPYPAYNWVELTRYDPLVSFDGGEVDLVARGLDLRLFEMLSALIPPGGHIMVEYDSPQQRATERMLTLGYPPAVTPTGYRLFQAGCRSYKNWYISEGGREGPRKLQGFKPLNQQVGEERRATLRDEVAALLSGLGSSGHRQWDGVARRNAEAVMKILKEES